MDCIKYHDNSHPGHLILAATNYTTAKLAGFYSSPLVEKLKNYDGGFPLGDRRLQHLEAIQGSDDFFDALLASAAIPVAFPPVKIRGSLYIDGGVGNNIPTREAAYFLRRLAQAQLGIIGEVFCVTQDPARNLIEEAVVGVGGMARRTWDVYYTVHTGPIVDAWSRINGDVRKQIQKVQEVKDAIATMGLAANVQQQIQQLLDSKLQPKQQDLSITFIQPSTALGDTLDFSEQKIKENIKRGYADFVNSIQARLTVPEKNDLMGRPIFPTTV